MRLDPQFPLELDGDEMRRLANEVIEHAVRHIEGLGSAPAYVATHERLDEVNLAHEELPETGEDFSELIRALFEDHTRVSYNTAGPGYLAYIPGGGLFHAALADLIANTINRYTGVAIAAPALAHIERTVIRWFCEIVGLPSESSGFFTSGGSLANLGALVTAREERLGEDFGNGVIYASSQTHHCVNKAARLAGFSERRLRILPADDRFRLQCETLEAAVQEDLEQGLRPFFVVASAGTTNTGAIDPFPALREVADRHDLWLHADAAYGGFFALTERGKERLAGLETVDSIVLDPHKTLFLPYGTGAVLLRDGGALRRTHSQAADYMPQTREVEDPLVDPCEISPELSKPFRGLRVWLPLKMHGITPFVESLDEKLDLAQWIFEQLDAMPELEVVAPPDLSTLAFAVADSSERSASERNKLTNELMDRVNRKANVHLTGTQLGELAVVRISIVSFRTHRDRIELCLQDIRDALVDVGLS